MIISSLTEKGSAYIYYYLPLKDFDYYTYPKNSYLRKNEIIKYVDNRIEIIKIIENDLISIDKPHLYNDEKHNHRYGSIYFTRDIKTWKYNYKIKCIKNSGN